MTSCTETLRKYVIKSIVHCSVEKVQKGNANERDISEHRLIYNDISEKHAKLNL